MSRSKNRKIADLISGTTFDDGVVAASEVTGLATVATSGSFSDLSNQPTPFDPSTLGTASTQATGAFATAAQGTTADAALPKAGGAVTGAITTNSTFDGRNVSVDGAKLDGIEANATADQTAAQLLTAIKTVDGAGSGLDADTLDGLSEATFMRRSANSGLDMNNNNITDVEDIYLQDRIYHDGDTDTYIRFHAANEFQIVTGGSERLEVNNSRTQIDNLEVTGTATFNGTVVGAGTPAGVVIYHAANTAPSGFLKANGASISTSTYSDLFAVIGYSYGGSGGSFNVPDLRGEFMRGWDDSRGVDSGRSFGSSQTDEFKSHNHTFTRPRGDASWNNGSGSNWWGSRNVTETVTSTGGSETRPRNVALLACIKY